MVAIFARMALIAWVNLSQNPKADGSIPSSEVF
jgi:hypothetical protein